MNCSGNKNYPRDHIKGDKSSGRVKVSLFQYPEGTEHNTTSFFAIHTSTIRSAWLLIFVLSFLVVSCLVLSCLVSSFVLIGMDARPEVNDKIDKTPHRADIATRAF
jgi:hypothetical protein